VTLTRAGEAESIVMKLVVGLGNPGAQYSGTRHNVGFDVIDELARRWNLGQPQMKFQAEMNRSGEPVQQLARFYQIASEDVAVICDDMNLPLGRLRWRASGSSGGQKGLADILLRLGTEQVPRLRMGVGRPPGQMDAAAWVLSRFRSEEREEAELMTKLAADSVENWVSEGIVSTMNKFNRSADD
jgi:PTH1 family peptidyl-tRNA hydrolase